MEARATRPLPPSREPTAHVYYAMTRGLCGVCGEPVDAKIRVRDGAMHFSKFCPTHGHAEVEVAGSAAWYLDALSFLSPSRPPAHTRKVARGCPRDCGPCELHQQKMLRAIVEPGEDAAAVHDALRREALPELLAPGIAAGDAVVVVTPSTTAQDLAPHLAALSAADGPATLELVPQSAGPGARVTIPHLQALLAAVCELRPDDFVPSPHAHPHCFSLAVLEPAADGRLVPLARRIGRAALFDLVGRPLAPPLKTVVLHALMDADDFDTARAMRCPIAYVRLRPPAPPVPDMGPSAPGRLADDSPLETTPLCARRALQAFGATP